MKVKIKTPNGFMTVDLAEFLPASKAKVRKLFRLMEQGIDVATKKSVREYLSTADDFEAVAEQLKGAAQ